eukprot:scaffold57679_cov47-Phaeocystis_antarctica.AAC.2
MKRHRGISALLRPRQLTSPSDPFRAANAEWLQGPDRAPSPEAFLFGRPFRPSPTRVRFGQNRDFRPTLQQLSRCPVQLLYRGNEGWHHLVRIAQPAAAVRCQLQASTDSYRYELACQPMHPA